jgi:hypothetical protein
MYHHLLDIVDQHADVINAHADDLASIDSALEDCGAGLHFHWDAIRALTAKVEALAGVSIRPLS